MEELGQNEVQWTSSGKSFQTVGIKSKTVAEVFLDLCIDG